MTCDVPVVTAIVRAVLFLTLCLHANCFVPLRASIGIELRRSVSPYSSSSHQHVILRMADDPNFDPTGNVQPEYQEFLKGPEGKPWKGTRIALPRKGQVPLPEYSAQDVVRICLSALQNNDDPQLDHGACVSLEFKSPMGPLSEGGLDPAAYGRFIRGSEYSSLIDFKSYELVGEIEQLSDSLSVRQKVRITDWQSSANSKGITFFDFYLTQVSGCWLLDIILIQK
jgi:hypothetical protein